MLLFKNYYLTFKTYFCIRSQLEFNRIARALNQTKIIIKEIYTQTYTWLEKRNTLHQNYSPNRYENYLLIKLHICVGLSFLAAFIDDFRKQSFEVRHQIQKIRNSPNTRQQVGQALFDSWDECLKWLKLKDEIEKAIPFNSNFWRTFFYYEIRKFWSFEW
jgi:hypothetical protein